jgi:hypothetical protein
MKRPAKRTKSPVKRTKSPARHEETTMRGRCPARIYARNRPRFANLSKMPNPDTKLLEKYFSHFIKNFRMPNLYTKLSEMLLVLLEKASYRLINSISRLPSRRGSESNSRIPYTKNSITHLIFSYYIRTARHSFVNVLYVRVHI